MTEPKRIVLDYKELADWMIKKNDIHEGIWGIYARFGLQAVNSAVQFEDGGSPQVKPTAVIPLIEIGLQEYPNLNELSLDAAIVNPRRKGSKETAKRRAKK